MTAEQRYGDDEIRKIVELASSGRSASPTSSDGLTLEELQSIGREIGLSPERISEAAATLAPPSAPPGRNLLGMPVSVNRTVSLPRLPSDHEWERLLVELRATFGAHGRDLSRGNLREWRNGNLFACIEPLDEGCQLRLGTTKGNAPILNAAGTASMVGGIVTLGTLAATHDLVGGNVIIPLLWGLVSAAAFGSNALRLPRWAKVRDAQMGRIADRARALMSGGPPDDLSSERTAGFVPPTARE